MVKVEATVIRERIETVIDAVEEATGHVGVTVVEAIGHGARKWLADAPKQILQREGECENVAAPAVRARHRSQKQAERRTRSEADQRDQASANNDDGRRPPGQRTRGLGNLVHVESPLSLVARQVAQRRHSHNLRTVGIASAARQVGAFRIARAASAATPMNIDDWIDLNFAWLPSAEGLAILGHPCYVLFARSENKGWDENETDRLRAGCFRPQLCSI